MTAMAARQLGYRVFVLDPMPISGATAVAAMDILKAWGEGLKPMGKTLSIIFVCIVASEAAIQFITEAHPDVTIHVGLVEGPIERSPRRGSHVLVAALEHLVEQAWVNLERGYRLVGCSLDGRQRSRR